MKEPFAWIKDILVTWLIPAAFIVIGFGGTFLDWQVFLDEGDIHPKIAFFAPLVGFLGLAMLLSPPGTPENMFESATAARRRAQRQRWALATFLVGLLAAGVSFALMAGWMGGLAG